VTAWCARLGRKLAVIPQAEPLFSDSMMLQGERRHHFGAPFLELFHYDRTEAGRARGNQKLISVPLEHPFADRVSVSSFGDWECVAWMVSRADLLPDLIDDDDNAVSRDEWEHACGLDGFEFLATLQREDAFSMARLEQFAQHCRDGVDIVDVLSYLGVSVRVDGEDLRLGEDLRPPQLRTRRRHRDQFRAMFPPQARFFRNGRLNAYDGNEKCVTFETRSHFFVIRYWTS